jgi:hypothetical protein
LTARLGVTTLGSMFSGPFGRALVLGLALAGAALARPVAPAVAECSLDAGAGGGPAVIARDAGCAPVFEPPPPVYAAPPVAPVIAAPRRATALVEVPPCRGALAPAPVSLDLAPKTSPPAA